jgi:hypothetical protein
MPTMEPHVQVTRYRVSLLTEEDDESWTAWSLYVEWAGRDRWAITRGNMSPRQVLDADDEWAWEVSDDRMDDTWLATHRFTMDDAIERAKRKLPFVKINGMTAADVRDKRWPKGRPGKPPGWT